jgi:phytoene dehydrogenase-like protein
MHNILFSQDYKQEFERIANNGPFWEDPTVYINITSKLESSDAPAGGENWFVMINVPHDSGQDWDTIIKKARKSIIERINAVLGCDLDELIEFEDVLEPRLIERRTSSVGGALYGTSSNDRMAAFLRHPNRHLRAKGLYLCGGSAHPGGGVPLCLLSGKIASEWLIEDFQ